MVYSSKYSQILEILTKQPRHRRLRRELPDGKKLSDGHLSLDFIESVWKAALIASRDPDRGAEKGREVEYYMHRADIMLWTSYFGHDEGCLEFPWEYDPPSQPARMLETRQEMGKKPQDELHLQNKPDKRADEKYKERPNHLTRSNFESRNTIIVKLPNRPFHRAVPHIQSSSLKQHPDARVFNAFEYTIENGDFQYPHSWIAKDTRDFGLIYLPPHFIYIPSDAWGAYIGRGGMFQRDLNERFQNIVKISGERLDNLTRLGLPRRIQCDVHGLFVQPVRKRDMDDSKIRAACEELAEQFLRSWVSSPDYNGKLAPIIDYWYIWVKNLGREPLILQLLKDLRKSTAQVKSSHQGTKRKNEDGVKPEAQRIKVELFPEGPKERRFDRDFREDKSTEQKGKGLE
ncbi:hypothetical protein HYFRA_00009136 [Hymenoscyphus fraxineus]|uniref:Uncharacterized protein n=1 Tax=Hymenoscyphus fraxineus TaxID=746836 RepID=A0A9N9PNX8_9HELO|nr:hypothetical protein HYFRA_00009136 [Hymenoscyphus fraxineus]